MRVGRRIAFASESNRRERAGSVDEDDAVAREAAQRGREAVSDAWPRRGIGEIHRHVFGTGRRAAREVHDARSREGQGADHRAADPARSAGDEDQSAAHVRDSGS